MEKKQRVVSYLPLDLYKRFKKKADEKLLDDSSYLRLLIKEAMDKCQKK